MAISITPNHSDFVNTDLGQMILDPLGVGHNRIQDVYNNSSEPGAPGPLPPGHFKAVMHALNYQGLTLEQATANWFKAPPVSGIVLGNWGSHFLSANRFFGPAIASRSEQEQRGYFSWLKGSGYRTVLINADQANWGPGRGNSEWTNGGFDVYKDNFNRLPSLLSTINLARSLELQVVLGIVDQPRLRNETFQQILDKSRALVKVTYDLICAYMLSWEIEEEWTNSTVREDNLYRWARGVNWHDRDIGIHFADGLKGGNGFYGEMNRQYPGHVTRFHQFAFDASDFQLREHTNLAIEVAQNTGTKWCNFEHSSERNTGSSDKTVEEVIRRRNVIMDQAGDRLPPERMGFMN